MTEYQDPIFGLLTFNKFAWEGVAIISALGGEVSLSVAAENETPPTDAQRQAFQEFQHIENRLKPDIEAEVYKYYSRVLEEYRDGYGECADEYAPVLQTSSEIWRLLSSPGALVLAQVAGEPPTVILTWECLWDSEHGLGAKVQGGQVVQVGEQGEFF